MILNYNPNLQNFNNLYGYIDNNQMNNYTKHINKNEMTIKGKYVNTLDEVIGLNSTDIEPAICVNFTSGKIYVKMFNLDGTYKIEEFIKNNDFVLDSRAEIDKVKDQLEVLMQEVSMLKTENQKLKGGTNSNESKPESNNNGGKSNK